MRGLGMVLAPAAIVTVTFANWNSGGRSGTAPNASFSVRSQHRFSVPTWIGEGAARSRGQDWPERSTGHRRRRARSGLDGGEHGARLDRVGTRSCGLPQGLILVLGQMLHVQIAGAF